MSESETGEMKGFGHVVFFDGAPGFEKPIDRKLVGGPLEFEVAGPKPRKSFAAERFAASGLKVYCTQSSNTSRCDILYSKRL